MTVEQAKQRLLSLIDQHGGYVAVPRIGKLASAAAHALATEPGIVVGEEADQGPHWFPHTYLTRQ